MQIHLCGTHQTLCQGPRWRLPARSGAPPTAKFTMALSKTIFKDLQRMVAPAPESALVDANAPWWYAVNKVSGSKLAWPGVDP